MEGQCDVCVPQHGNLDKLVFLFCFVCFFIFSFFCYLLFSFLVYIKLVKTFSVQQRGGV